MQRYDVTILLYSILICCVHQPLSCSSQQPHSLCIFSFRQGRRSRTKTDIIVHKTVTSEITHHRMSMLNSHDEDGKKARSSQVLEVGDDNNPSHLEKGLATMAQDSTFSGEPEDDLWWLELLFGLCFLPTKKRSSRGWRYLNVFYCLCSTFVSCGSTIYVSLNPHNHGSLMSSLGLVWALNVMFVYLYLSYSQRQSPDLIDKLRSISKSPLHPQLLKQPTDFTRVCKIPVLITIFVWILNVCVTLFRIRAVVMSNFGLSDNIYFIVFVAYLSLHISFLCWYLPIPIVYTGCYYLGRRVEAMHNVVVNEFAKDENVNFITLTDMYAELFSLNLTLNSCISLLFSFVTILLAVFLFFMIFVSIGILKFFPISAIYIDCHLLTKICFR